MNVEKQYELIAKLLSGNSTEGEQAELNQWLSENTENAQVFEQAKQAWELTQQQTVVADTDAAWSKLRGSIAVEEKTEVIRISPVAWMGRIAAAVAVLVGIGFLFNSYLNQPELKTIASADKALKVVLPDSSVVWLNKNSQISYLEQFDDNREVKLKGEGFFDVVHDAKHTFSVEANGTTITDIGTSFNIRAYDNESKVNVSVATGIVEFSSAKKERMVLNEGFEAWFDVKNATMQKAKSESANYMAWKTGKLVFDKNSLQQVAATLGEYYGTDFTVNGTAATILFTGTFDQASITDAIRILETSTGVQISKEQKGYTISGR